MIRTMIFKDELSKRVEEANLIIDSYIPEAGSHDREIICVTVWMQAGKD